MLRMVVGSDSVATSAKIQEKEREKKNWIGLHYLWLRNLEIKRKISLNDY
jgi:hypothetical protein